MKKLQCWCWAEPLSSPQELSQEHEPLQSWWHGADWRGGWCQETSCHDSAPQCRAPGRTRPCQTVVDMVHIHSEVESSCNPNTHITHMSNLILLVVLNLVVQAQLDQVQHHAQHMFRHVLMIHPYLEYIKWLPSRTDKAQITSILYLREKIIYIVLLLMELFPWQLHACQCLSFRFYAP